jgi:hypothetical protein
MLLLLLLTRPCFQLLPISTLVDRPKPVHSVNLLINNLQCRIRLTHKRLANKVNTMAYMALLDINWQILVFQLLAL